MISTEERGQASSHLKPGIKWDSPAQEKRLAICQPGAMTSLETELQDKGRQKQCHNQKLRQASSWLCAWIPNVYTIIMEKK